MNQTTPRRPAPTRARRARRGAAVLAAAAAAAGAVAFAAPSAQAANVRTLDPADIGGPNDIRVVDVAHTYSSAIVNVRFSDLRRTGPGSVAIYLDTNPNRTGPEFRLASGLSDGTDYSLVRTKGWRPSSGPLECNYNAKIDFTRETFKTTISRACLGRPAKVRASVEMIEDHANSEPRVDWAPRYRAWTPWVKVG